MAGCTIPDTTGPGGEPRGTLLIRSPYDVPVVPGDLYASQFASPLTTVTAAKEPFPWPLILLAGAAIYFFYQQRKGG